LESSGVATARDCDGRSCLHYAAGYGNEECVDLLLERGANAQVADGNGGWQCKQWSSGWHAVGVWALDMCGAVGDGSAALPAVYRPSECRCSLSTAVPCPT
jgi:hypothetical protein